MRRAAPSARPAPGRRARRAAWRGAAAGAAGFALLWAAVPWHADRVARYPASLELLDRGGRPLRVRLGPGGLDCRPVALADAGEWTAKALVAVEDRRFFLHPGVDPLAVLRAAGQNLLGGRIVSGASTLSSQVIRMTDPAPRTVRTKIAEFVRALKMERLLGKEAILEQYLNRAPQGGNLVGVEAAARRYFGKAARDLSAAEAALLMGLPQSPARYRPDRHFARARARQLHVLERMEACGFLTPEERRRAAAQPVRGRRDPLPFAAPHFCELVLARTGRPAGGTALRTTLDAALQAVVEERVALRGPALAADGIDGCAVVVLEVDTGAVRALVGSPDYRGSPAGQVNAAAARRSPGSALKPFLYARAFDEGLLAPDSIVRDEPVRYPGYEPRNFDESFLGPVTARDALVLSLNIPAVRLVQQLGLPRVVGELRGLGLATLDRPAETYGVALAVGSGEVTPLDLANAYAGLARLGLWRPCRILETTAAGAARRVLSPEAAFLVADILGGEERALDLAGHVADARMPRAAWKTGTSAGHRDAWTVLYNPEWVVAVWLGRTDGRGVAGLAGSRATPLAYDVLRALYPGGEGPWFDPPPGLRRRALAAGVAGRSRAWDYAIPGVSPPPAGASGAARVRETPPPLAIEDPRDGAVFRRLPDAPGIRQELPLRARGATGRVWWFADGAPLGSAAPGETLFWPLAPGAVTLACADAAGRRACVGVRVE